MTGFITQYGENFLLDLVCRRVVSPEHLYLALLTQDATKYSSGYTISEPTVAEYRRIKLGNAPGNWVNSGGQMFNADDIEVPFNFLEQWPIIVGWALCDNAEGGNMLWGGGMLPWKPSPEATASLPKGGLIIRTATYSSGLGR